MKAIALGRAACMLAAGLTAFSLAAAEPASPAAGADADSANPASDALFKEPFIDIDEWRDAPVRHRYVHGGRSAISPAPEWW